MAQIDYNKIELIVENNLRNAGLQGTFENGWKDSVSIDGNTYNAPFNLQDLRDIIAKSIVDALTDPTVGGSLSAGNVQGSPAVSPNTSIINLTTGSVSKEAVRVGDETEINAITDPKFVAWMTAVNVFITACQAVTGPTTASAVGVAATAYNTAGATLGGFPPTTATGETTTGSATVKIGD